MPTDLLLGAALFVGCLLFAVVYTHLLRQHRALQAQTAAQAETIAGQRDLIAGKNQYIAFLEREWSAALLAKVEARNFNAALDDWSRPEEAAAWAHLQEGEAPRAV